MRADRKLRTDATLDMLKDCLKRAIPVYDDDRFEAIIRRLNPEAEPADRVLEPARD